MKKTHLIHKNFLALLCAGVLILCAGCKNNITTPNASKKPLIDELAPTDILSRYDVSNIFGLVVARTESYSTISHTWPSSGRTNFTGTQSWGYANFIDSAENPLDMSCCYLNFQYIYQAPGLFSCTGQNLPVYTDGVTPNVLILYGIDSTTGYAIDSITFGTAPSITNIVRGQNISRDSTITVTWTGTSSDFVSVTVSTWDSTGTHDTIGQGVAVGGYYNNTGSATISLIPQQLQLGLADVELRKFEPHFVTLSSGKRVCILAETCEAITVHIVN